MDTKQIIEEGFRSCRSPTMRGEKMVLHRLDRVERALLWVAVQAQQREFVGLLQEFRPSSSCDSST